VTVRRSLLVLRQRLFKKSSLCLEERPVLLEHLLLQLQRSLHHSTHVTVTYTQTHTQTDRQTDRQTSKQTDKQTDRQTDRQAGILTNAQCSLNICCSFTHSNNCSLHSVLCRQTKLSILVDGIPAAEDYSEKDATETHFRTDRYRNCRGWLVGV